MKPKQRSASHSGFHFMNLFQCCNWKFFLRYVKRVEPKTTGRALIYGAAFHEAKAVFYNTKSLKKAQATVKREIMDRRAEYEREEDYEDDMFKGPLMIEDWARSFGYDDLKRFNFIAVEKELKVIIPKTNSFIMTMRPDALVEDKQNGDIFIMETKTSSFSIKTTFYGVLYGDQATAYSWAVRENYPEYYERLVGVMPDIAYWNKSTNNIGNLSCHRPEIIPRTDYEIDEFALGVSSIVNEISQKISAYRKGYDKHALFPRNTAWCNSFSKPCEYVSICRGYNISDKGRLPLGFKRTRQTKARTVVNPVDDNFGGD